MDNNILERFKLNGERIQELRKKQLLKSKYPTEKEISILRETLYSIVTKLKENDIDYSTSIEINNFLSYYNDVKNLK